MSHQTPPVSLTLFTPLFLLFSYPSHSLPVALSCSLQRCIHCQPLKAAGWPLILLFCNLQRERAASLVLSPNNCPNPSSVPTLALFNFWRSCYFVLFVFIIHWDTWQDRQKQLGKKSVGHPCDCVWGTKPRGNRGDCMIPKIGNEGPRSFATHLH